MAHRSSPFRWFKPPARKGNWKVRESTVRRQEAFGQNPNIRDLEVKAARYVPRRPWIERPSDE